MGHATNLNTLRQIKQSQIYYKKNSKEFLLAYTYQNLLEKLFRRNKIFLTKCQVIFNQNKFYCHMSLFFQYRSFIRIKKRIKKNALKLIKKQNLSLNNLFTLFPILFNFSNKVVNVIKPFKYALIQRRITEKS